MSRDIHSKGWSSSTKVEYRDDENVIGRSGARDGTGKSTSGRKSVLEKLSNLVKTEDESGHLVPVCETINIIKMDSGDISNDINPAIPPHDVKVDGEEKQETAPCQTEQSKGDGQNELKSVISVYHHRRAACYEIVAFNIAKDTEMNRLYVPASEVKELTRRKTRLSFVNATSHKKISEKFADLLMFTIDENKNQVMGFKRTDSSKTNKKYPTAIKKPEGLTPAAYQKPSFTSNGTLAPKGKRVSLFSKIGQRLSIWKKNAQTHPKQAPVRTQFDSVPTNAEADEGMNENGPCPIKTIPRENSSTDLNSHLKYDKSVNSMLDEAAQMRKDLEAKRAAKKKGKK